MDAEEVGKAVAHVVSLPEGVVINELNISAVGLPELCVQNYIGQLYSYILFLKYPNYD